MGRGAEVCRGNKVCESWKKGCTRHSGAEKMSEKTSLWLRVELVGKGRGQRIERQAESHHGRSWLRHGQEQHLV